MTRSVRTTTTSTPGRTLGHRKPNHPQDTTPASRDASLESSGSTATNSRVLPPVFSMAAQTPLFAVEITHPDGTTEIGPAGLTAEAADTVVVNLSLCTAGAMTARKRSIRWELAEKGGAA
jgi:hypothetical protein